MLHWAILGTGFISTTVVEAMAASPGSAVVSVAGRNRERLDAFAETYDIARRHTDYVEAVQAPDVDAVYIGLPNHKHHDLATAAAEAGKAVLSEKSLTTTMAAAHSLVDAVRDRVFFVEGLMYLAHPLLARMMEVLGRPSFGTLKSINGAYAADIKDVVNPLGRGTIYNLGCYPASLLHLVIQTCLGPDAFAERRSWGAGTLTADGTVGQAVLGVEFANGVLASLHSSDDFGMAHHFSVSTDQGVLAFETNPWLPEAGTNTLVWTPYDGEVERTGVVDPHDAFHHQIRLVEDAVRQGFTEAARPSPRLADSLEIMELLTEWEAHCLLR